MPALKSLTDEELAEILALVKDADSVELKLTVRETARAKTVAALGIDSLKGNELAVRLQQGLELELPATLVWNYPTVAHIAAHVAEREPCRDDLRHGVAAWRRKRRSG